MLKHNSNKLKIFSKCLDFLTYQTLNISVTINSNIDYDT